MERDGWEAPLLIAQDSQIARAFFQLKKLLGCSPIVRPLVDGDGRNLTNHFDLRSVQLWTKNKYLWLIRQTPERAYLLAKRKV